MLTRESYIPEQNRNEAFFQVLNTLSARQQEVFTVINNNQPCSNEEIAAILNLPVHYVTGRVLELRNLEIVVYAGSAKSKSSNKTVSKWRINEAGKQLSLFEAK